MFNLLFNNWKFMIYFCLILLLVVLLIQLMKSNDNIQGKKKNLIHIHVVG